MGCGGERDERGHEERNRSAHGVDDGKDPERQQGEIDHEDRRYDRAVDSGECVE